MAGVTVTTATRSGPSAPLRAASGQFFVAGITERGSNAVPILLRGMADYEALCGARVSYGSLFDALKCFFDEGGSQAYVARVTGAAATLGTRTLVDRAGTPISTLRVDAANPGAWSSGLTVEVAAGSVAGTYRIIVRLGGQVVEDRTNLVTPADAAAAFAGSAYVTVVDLGSATVAPNNQPAILAATALTAGDDARASIVAADYVTALNRFTAGYGDGAVAIPGLGSTVHAGLIAHAEAQRRIALLASTRTASTTDLMTTASALNSSSAGLFAPWVRVSDGGSGFRTISPEGFVAAKRSQAHDLVGPWRAPAGEIGKATTGTGVLGLDYEWTRAQTDALENGRVNPIRIVANSIRLYGWRSLSTDEANYAFLSGRDLLNRLVVEAELRLEKYVFMPIDGKGQLLSSINAELVGMVEPIRAAGGLFERVDAVTGDPIDSGYKVETGSEVNSPVTLANNEVRARLSVRVSPTGALVSLTIVKVGVLAGL